MRLVKRESSVYEAGAINKGTDKSLPLTAEQYRSEYNIIVPQSTAPQGITHRKVTKKSKPAVSRLRSE